MRLDRAVAARGLARSRSHARQLIDAGLVLIGDEIATRPSREVPDDARLSLARTDHYVSRAAHKLLGALDACTPLGLEVAGRHALDAGASTGGFTQVLLERGAARVTAIDVGHGQLDPSLRDDARVEVHEGVNVRQLTPGGPGADADLVVADLSFISLTLVIGALRDTAAPHADFLLMVKPQFEVGRGRLDKHGVVPSAAHRAEAIGGVCRALQATGADIHMVRASEVPGESGNVECFVWASEPWQARGGTPRPTLTGDRLARAVQAQAQGRS